MEEGQIYCLQHGQFVFFCFDPLENLGFRLLDSGTYTSTFCFYLNPFVVVLILYSSDASLKAFGASISQEYIMNLY